MRGEVRAHPFDRNSTLLLELDEVLVRFVEGERKGEEHEVSIDSARIGNEAILLKLHAVENRDQAIDLRGVQLCARRNDFPPVEEGEFYACDVIGARVLGPEGVALGTVREFASYPSVDILVIEGDSGRYEVPLVDAFVASVDIDHALVVLRTLEGLEPTPSRG
ncbi:MAG: ribosome maturation factor RimM [Polyangiales bacterium]